MAYSLPDKKDTHLPQDQRYHIRHHLNQQSPAEIARALNRSKNSIIREIKRHQGKDGVYKAGGAQNRYTAQKQQKRKPYKLTESLTEYINILFILKLSPEQIFGYLKKHHHIKTAPQHHLLLYTRRCRPNSRWK
ncbi:helix-turn-helix domain-containing protein [Neisseria iguanae]|uniref:helix-turn-helix domain-containing protein n=1 Tax=Neisseria iguanae TaxID=90242 RepID=UPI001474FD58